MPSIVHFEIPADDISRAKTFYSNLFGWKIEPMQGMGTGGNGILDYRYLWRSWRGHDEENAP